jgi:hypothetical protein
MLELLVVLSLALHVAGTVTVTSTPTPEYPVAEALTFILTFVPPPPPTGTSFSHTLVESGSAKSAAPRAHPYTPPPKVHAVHGPLALVTENWTPLLAPTFPALTYTLSPPLVFPPPLATPNIVITTTLDEHALFV